MLRRSHARDLVTTPRRTKDSAASPERSVSRSAANESATIGVATASSRARNVASLTSDRYCSQRSWSYSSVTIPSLAVHGRQCGSRLVIGEVIRVARSLRTLSHCLGGNTVQLRPRGAGTVFARGQSPVRGLRGPAPTWQRRESTPDGSAFPRARPVQGALPGDVTSLRAHIRLSHGTQVQPVPELALDWSGPPG
jgi:hypothetical protein